MKNETLEIALHDWPEWPGSIAYARKGARYEPKDNYEKRLEWWQGTSKEFLSEVCPRVLTRLRLPYSFSRYWTACFLSDYSDGKTFDFERIRVPIGWFDNQSWPSYPPPPGCMRVEVGFRRMYRGKEPMQDPEKADSVRMFPPSLVASTIPKLFPHQWNSDKLLRISLVPRQTWKTSWKDHLTLPILSDPPQDAQPWHWLVNYSGEQESTLLRWVWNTRIEIPPWAMSDDNIRLARDQAEALRDWYEYNHLHPLSTYLKSAAATASPRTGALDLLDLNRWLEQYEVERMSYLEVVRKVYERLCEGRVPNNPPTRPQNARRAADLVRNRARKMGLNPGKLRRYWWRYI